MDASRCGCSACATRCGFLVADWRGEVDFYVGFQHANAHLFACWFNFQHGNVVHGFIVAEAKDVALCECREVAECIFEDGFWVGDIEEVGILWLKFDKGGGGEVGGFDLEEVAGLKLEGSHHLGILLSALWLRWVICPRTQNGKYTLPSSATNSSTPACVCFSLEPLMSSKSIGYVICSFV